ncbi:MAG: cytochrome c [Ottowia sp.]|nr:cytochrome c [Ottowia sp.]
MNKMLTAAALVAAFAALPAQAQFAKAEDAVAYRQGAYRVLAQHFGSLGAMANGKAPFDAARAAADGEVLAVIAKLPAAGFVAGAESKGAKPAIWTEADKFKKLDQDLVTAAGALATAAKSGDLEQIKAAFGPTAKTCKACHDEFRQK